MYKKALCGLIISISDLVQKVTYLWFQSSRSCTRLVVSRTEHWIFISLPVGRDLHGPVPGFYITRPYPTRNYFNVLGPTRTRPVIFFMLWEKHFGDLFCVGI